MEETLNSEVNKSCANCGAELKFKPGSHQLKCAYCGYEEFIEQTKSSFEELELQHYLKIVGENAYTETIDLLHLRTVGQTNMLRKTISRSIVSIVVIH